MSAEEKPQSATDLLIKVMEDKPDDITDIVVAYRTKNGWIKWTSNTSTPMAVGLLECAKSYILEGWQGGKDYDSPESDGEEDDKE